MKQNITLTIDSSDNQETKVSIKVGNETKTFLEKSGSHKSQTLLPLIDAALHSLNLVISDITDIEVNPGPGSFTGTRVGVTIANALGWVLQIPVNGKKIETPHYSESKFD